MKISESERQSLGSFLGSNLYARAKEQVLESVTIDVIGSLRPSDVTALDLSYKEGMNRAFKILEGLTSPIKPKSQPVSPTPLVKRTTKE